MFNRLEHFFYKVPETASFVTDYLNLLSNLVNDALARNSFEATMVKMRVLIAVTLLEANTNVTDYDTKSKLFDHVDMLKGYVKDIVEGKDETRLNNTQILMIAQGFALLREMNRW